MLLLELFGGLATLLTAVGVYGVIAFSVAERTREFGIRAALGAAPRDILALVFGRGLVIVGAGLAIGVLLAGAMTRYLQESLYATSATDPPTFVGVAALIFAVAAIAQLVPVMRAMRVDPSIALRQE